tara:strand:- start:1770 stop:1949 length:180 start_codon:yes stop_codon:yes gene_type:complete
LDKPSPHISKHYSLIGIKPGVVIFKGEKLDFRTISKERADRAYAAGCHYLRKKQKPKEN